MKHILAIIFTLTFSCIAAAADLQKLGTLFQENFNTFYRPRFCGQNIERLVREASKRNINLSNSIVLKIEGAGFLETSGFFTRSNPNERGMLGYFHFVLVADGYVFDFDLYEPLILPLEDYIRLQFTPAYQPYRIFGILFEPEKELKYWTVSGYELADYLGPSPKPVWKRPMGEFVDLSKMVKRKRAR